MDGEEPGLRRRPELRVGVPRRRAVQEVARSQHRRGVRLPGHLPVQLGHDEGLVRHVRQEGGLVS